MSLETPANALRDVRHLLIDMDGVLFRGSAALPAADEFLPWLRSRGIDYRLLTNNSTASPADNAAKLAALGIEVDAGEVFTSAQATAEYLVDQGAAGQQAYVVGEAGLREALQQGGIDMTVSEHVEWVVAGLDRAATYSTLAGACRCLDAGARFVATNSDSSLPVEAGRMPGAGALQALITATTGAKPTVIGKPQPAMLEQAMKLLGGTRTDTVMLGDRLDTDIEAAERAGVRSILVLTGVSGRDDLRRSPVQPNLVRADLPDLMARW